MEEQCRHELLCIYIISRYNSKTFARKMNFVDIVLEQSNTSGQLHVLVLYSIIEASILSGIKVLIFL